MAGIRKDAWSNVLSGMAGRSDKSQLNKFEQGRVLHYNELAAIYAGDGIGTRIVDIIPDDMTRAGWTFENDQDGRLGKEMKKLGAASKINLALKWSRLFGGGLLMLDLDDGQSLETPYDWNKGNAKVRGIKVFSSARTIISASDFSSDPQSPYFEELEFFTIRRLYAAPFRVHVSRCIVFKGKPLPDTVEQVGYDLNTRYWGMSIFQTIFGSLSNFGTFFQGISHLGGELTIGKYKISNLENLVAENDWKAIKNRLRAIDEQKSLIHAVLLGKEEDYTRDSLTFTGVPDVMDRLMMVLSSCSRIPVSKLFGRGPQGMNATGEGDARDYYDAVGADQMSQLEIPLQKLAALVSNGIGKRVDPDGVTVKFNPVWTPSQKELADIQKTVMETDRGYVDGGILHPEQVFDNRFKNGYTSTYQIEGGYVEPEEPEDDDPEMQAKLEAAAAEQQAGTAPKGRKTSKERNPLEKPAEVRK